MLQFLFVQSWYTLWSVSMLALFLLPVLALVLNTPVVHVHFWDFARNYLPVPLGALLVWVWSRQWHQPKGFGLSWRGIVLHVARWPVVLSALIQVILGVEKPYMITTKGLQKGEERPFSLEPQAPYLVLFIVSLVACWINIKNGRNIVQGNLLYALEGAAFLLVVFATALFRDILEMYLEGVSFLRSVVVRLWPLVVLFVLYVSLVWTYLVAEPRIIEAINYGQSEKIEVKHENGNQDLGRRFIADLFGGLYYVAK